MNPEITPALTRNEAETLASTFYFAEWCPAPVKAAMTHPIANHIAEADRLLRDVIETAMQARETLRSGYCVQMTPGASGTLTSRAEKALAVIESLNIMSHTTIAVTHALVNDTQSDV